MRSARKQNGNVSGRLIAVVYQVADKSLVVLQTPFLWDVSQVKQRLKFHGARDVSLVNAGRMHGLDTADEWNVPSW
jgi:hypothetical protein